MCKAFSCIVGKNKKVYWKLGMDSHEDIIRHFKLSDSKINSDFVRIELSPDNRDYVRPDKWVLKFDNYSELAPDWWKKSHEQETWSAWKEWKKKIYSLIKLDEAKNPINPFKIAPQKVTKKVLRKLKQWDSVGASVWDSVGASVWDSVGASVGDSVRDSVWASVRASVWDSVGASVRASVWDSVGASVWDSVRVYIGSLFRLKRKQWKYTDKIKCKGYPFQSVVDLWKLGFVASFDGTKWKLHAGKKAKIVWEGTKKELLEACK